MIVHFVLYVRDQAASARFYSRALATEPRLDVPGMTEFAIGDAVLGLMPEAGIRRLLGDSIGDPASARVAPRAEIYLVIDDPVAFVARATDAGGRVLSPLAPRDWGHDAAYVADPDGHVVAFARVSR